VPESTPPNPAPEPACLLMIVVGAHLRAEVADRPLAYRLLEAMHQWIGQHLALMDVPLAPVVCSDIWYMNHEELQRRPTISLGGPGVNALSAYWTQKLSPAVVRDDQLLIQLDPEFVDLRVCLWGMNHQRTIEALDYFLEHYLDSYLRAVATQVEPQEG
jgi:hypothetical protein